MDKGVEDTIMGVLVHILTECDDSHMPKKGGFLASQDALEVMFVSTLLIVSTDFTYVTLVSNTDDDHDDHDEQSTAHS